MNVFTTYFLNVVKNHYFDFNSRANRQQFWMYTLVYAIIYIAFAVLTAVTPKIGWIFALVNTLLGLALILPSLSITARRLHDTDHTGWWMLINLLPLVGNIIFLVFLVLPGTPGQNRFGSAK